MRSTSFLGLTTLVVAGALTLGKGAAGTIASESGITGRVFDGSALLTAERSSTVIPTDLPTVPGAQVHIQSDEPDTRVPRLVRDAATDADGSFAFRDISVPEPYLKVSVEVSAPGFGTWRITGAPVRPNGNLLDLYVELMPYAQNVLYTPPEEESLTTDVPTSADAPVPLETRTSDVSGGLVAAQPATTSSSARTGVSTKSGNSALRNAIGRGEVTGSGNPDILLSSCSSFSSNLWPPPRIRVWRRDAGEGFVRIYDFKFYIKHVLPSEWIADWPANSLRAGAVAVENYGWYWVNNWRGWHVGVPASGECYDVDDTIFYQVFNPNVDHPRTNAAIDVSWNFIAKKSGAIFETSYRDTLTGNQNESCGAGANGSIMSQFGSRQCANQGMGWQDIVRAYYYNPPVTFQFIKTDFSGDGCADMIGRVTDGTGYLYKGNCAGGWLDGGAGTPIGSGWNVFTSLLGPGDFSGDGCADVIGRVTDGTGYLHKGNCAGGWLDGGAGTQIGSGWNVFSWLLGPGDFSGDGCADMIGRVTDGTGYLYKGNCAGGWLDGGAGTQIGSGWNVFSWLLGPGDFSGDGCADMIGRVTGGTGYLYKGNCAGGWLEGGVGTQIGSGWNVFSWLW